jgi:hypothetical protein
MKKLLLLFVLSISAHAYAQESVLLRTNYSEGDVFDISVVQKQIVGMSGSNDMTITMEMEVTDIEQDTITTESKITSIDMKMNQGGMVMNFNSNQDESELDQTGKLLKQQFDPMMNATIYSKADVYGNVIETKAEPTFQGVDQFSGQTSMDFPKEAVSVGSTWTTENVNQGMTVKTTYMVTDITNGIVALEMKGDVSGAGTGELKGTSSIDVATGIASTNTEIVVTAQGMQITIVSQTNMTKQ